MLPRWYRSTLLVSLLTAGLGACADDDATLQDDDTGSTTGPEPCAVGQMRDCSCDGVPGAQSCVGVGEWGPCECGDATITTTSTTGDPTGETTGVDLCGNGVVDDDEQCDDGNDVDDDDCSNACVGHCGVMWESEFPGDLPSLAIGSRGEILVDVVGTDAMSNEVQPTRVRLSAGDGTVVETLEVGPRLTDAEFGYSAASGNDTTYLLGVTGVDGSAVEPRLLRLDIGSGLAWDTVMSANLRNGVQTVAVTPDGDPVVVGEVDVVKGDTDLWVAKYDADDGSEVWTTTHTGPTDGGFSLDEAGRIAVADNGDIYAVGRLRKTFNRRELSLLRFGPGGGAAQWETVVLPDPGPNNDHFMESLALGPNGAIAVGMTAEISGVERLRAIRYDGESETSIVDDDMIGIANDRFVSFRATFDGAGNLVIVGGRDAGGVFETFIARYDSVGQQLCAELLGTAGGIYTVAALPDGRVVYGQDASEPGMSRIVMVRP